MFEKEVLKKCEERFKEYIKMTENADFFKKYGKIAEQDDIKLKIDKHSVYPGDFPTQYSKTYTFSNGKVYILSFGCDLFPDSTRLEGLYYSPRCIQNEFF